MNTSRIRDLAKQQGKSVTYICKLIDRPKYYLNDVDKKPDRMISDEDLKTLAINLGTTAEYLKGETDDPLFHLSSVGLTTEPYEKIANDLFSVMRPQEKVSSLSKKHWDMNRLTPNMTVTIVSGCKWTEIVCRQS